MTFQRCPNCGREHDVRVYVTGQRALCACGIHFEVRRNESGSIALEAATALRQPEPVTVDATVISQTVTQVQIPGYVLRELLGRGGMGEVWRAEQQSLGRMVAIKVLPPRLAGDPEFVARFAKEATALASLSHPHIVQIIDRGVAGEHYYFVMEYVEGTTLRERMGQGPTLQAEVLRIGTQLCRAVDYAHERHIVHRDLKPENILLDGHGHVKVADFGLAGFRAPDSGAKITATAIAMGTVNYMAPEQRRDAGSVDHRADIYSIGVILYELLTGELPLGRFRAPSERIPGLDPRLDVVVLRALESDPSARYAHASILGETLERMLAEASTGPRMEAQAPREGSRRWLRGVAWVGGMALVALVGLLLARRPHPPPNDGHDHAGAGRWPGNTDHALGVAAAIGHAKAEETVEVGFQPGEEVINAHAGRWRLHNGRLVATQAGGDSGGQPLLAPRAYLGKRYYLADDFHAEVSVELRELESDFPVEPNAQHFAELSFRVTDLQVSVLAVPEQGMRVGWRYFRRDGRSVAGNSAAAIAQGVEDEAPFPGFQRTFRMGLSLKRAATGVEVEGTVNGAVFFRRFLEGLQGQVAKVAVGCRNLHCAFADLKIRGKPTVKPDHAISDRQAELAP